ncbi:MAG: hypothetical protein HC881_23000 [Leptolyngbyaceae cyanobacterium SL_7_1]|nr:hypothetical protein [Leptolyngbyaceae cyanobacterium SL_7_1]
MSDFQKGRSLALITITQAQGYKSMQADGTGLWNWVYCQWRSRLHPNLWRNLYEH